MSSPDTTDRRIASGMRAQLALRSDLLASGRRHLGWKMGFGSAAAMERLGTRAPLVGFLTDASLIQTGETCSLAGWKRATLEPEIAAYIGAGGVIAALGAAIELVDPDPDVRDVEAILTGDIFHRHLLLGPQQAGRAGGSVAGISVRVRRDGEEVAATSDPEALTGRVTDIVRSASATLEAHGERLHAGDVVILGSTVPPIPVEPGQHLRVEIEPLGVLEVRFA